MVTINKFKIMKRNNFFDTIEEGMLKGLTFKEWFTKGQRLGLMVVILFFIVLVQFKAYQGEFEGETTSYYLATGITLITLIVFILGVVNHWNKLKQIAKRTK